MELANIRVVLVRPQIAGNVGATARIMRNMGFANLILVAPTVDPTDPRARQRSTHGEPILWQARIVSSLQEALADCLLAAGTSARIGGLFRRQSVGPPGTILPRLLASSRHGPVALVFGPEPTGLTDEEVTLCNYLIHIPAETSYPALNLAQAVAICLYEVRNEWLRGSSEDSASLSEAPFVDLDRMYASLRIALEEIHFLYGAKGNSLMHALRHLFGRARPTQMEVKLLLGLAPDPLDRSAGASAQA